MLGAFASANNAPISFYNVYKIYKDFDRLQRVNIQHFARGYVVKKPVKCRQETRKTGNLNRPQMSSRNPQNVGPQQAANVVKKSPKRGTSTGRKCRQEIPAATTKQARNVGACPVGLFGLFLFVGSLFSVRVLRCGRRGPLPTVNRFPFCVGVFSVREKTRRRLPFKHTL